MVVDLAESREKIDAIDKQIVDLFEERMKVATDVANYKRSTGKKVFDPEREEQKLAALREMVDGEFNKVAVEDLFRQIMSISRKHQYQELGPSVNDIPFEEVNSLEVNQDTKVVCFGKKGSFTEQAMVEVFGEDIIGIHKDSFREIMAEVATGNAQYGVLPIENSTTGAVEGINDLLMEYNVTIVAEHTVKVEQNLLGVPGAKADGIKTVFSHPQGIMQCDTFLREHNVATKHYSSTAAAAKKIAEDGDKSVGAIASKRAADVFGLEVIKESINDEKDNFTRFIIITNKKIFLSNAEKLCLCFEIKHQVGALYNILANFYYNNLNLAKIESRPIENRKWEYRFFVDVEGNVNSPGVGNALASLGEFTSKTSVLGNIAKL